MCIYIFMYIHTYIYIHTNCFPLGIPPKKEMESLWFIFALSQCLSLPASDYCSHIPLHSLCQLGTWFSCNQKLIGTALQNFPLLKPGISPLCCNSLSLPKNRSHTALFTYFS